MKTLFAVLALLCCVAAPRTGHAQTTLNTGTGTETLTLTDTSCNSTTPCDVQIYRATGACPASGIGTLTYTELASALLGNPVGTTSETFTYADTTAMQGTTYCYYATATYMGNTGSTPTPGYPPSLPSATYTAVIPFSTPTAPATLMGIWAPTA